MTRRPQKPDWITSSEAGVQSNRQSLRLWLPACAGMTGRVPDSWSFISDSRSALKLRGQTQHLTTLLFAIGGQSPIAARGIDRDGAEQLSEAIGAGEVEAQIGAARQVRDLLERRGCGAVAAFVKQKDR